MFVWPLDGSVPLSATVTSINQQYKYNFFNKVKICVNSEIVFISFYTKTENQYRTYNYVLPTRYSFSIRDLQYKTI